MKRIHLLLWLALAFAALAAHPAAWAVSGAVKDETVTQPTKEKKKVPPRAQKKPPAKSQAAAKPKPPPSKSASTKPAPVKAPAAKPPAPVFTNLETYLTRAGDYNFSIEHGGSARIYRVHVPVRYSPAEPAPLVVALQPGAITTPQAQENVATLTAKSDLEGFIVVFAGTSGKAGDTTLAAWNAGACCGGARDQNVDDVGFISTLVSNVFRQVSVRRSRIYAVGMSTGGMMAYRLACELPEVFNAVASVAGTDNTADCKPSEPVSVLHIHARNDPRVGFNGAATAGSADRSRMVQVTSAPETAAKWAMLNGCSPAPQAVLEKAGAICYAWSYCRAQAEVQLCATDSGGHTWPGTKGSRGENPSQAISATDTMWAFFSRH